MFFVTELSEDIKAQKLDKDSNVTQEVMIPKGTKISIQDTGESAEVLAPIEYAGLVIKSKNINNDLKQ